MTLSSSGAVDSPPLMTMFGEEGEGFWRGDGLATRFRREEEEGAT